MWMNCVIYLSEAKNTPIIQQCVEYCRRQQFPLIHWFQDCHYNRSSFYFITPLSSFVFPEENLAASVASEKTIPRGTELFIQQLLSVCKFGHDRVDYRSHSGAHPTLGSIDHICFSPLVSISSDEENQSSAFQEQRVESLSQCSLIAKQFADEYYEQFRIPVYCYGTLSDDPTTPQRLQNIRRHLGYFQSPESFSPSVLQEKVQESSLRIPPSRGSWKDYHVERGVTCIGCIPLIQNYNIRLRPSSEYWRNGGSSSEIKSVIASITKQIRSGNVEALTLPYSSASFSSSAISNSQEEKRENDCFEIACNLLAPYPPDGTTSDQIYSRVQQLAQERHLEIITAYSTNPLEHELILKYQQYYETLKP